MGRQISYIAVSAEDFKGSLLSAGMPEWDAHVMAEIMSVFAEGRYTAIETDLPTLLGRAPRTFAQFVEDHKAAFAPKAA